MKRTCPLQIICLAALTVLSGLLSVPVCLASHHEGKATSAAEVKQEARETYEALKSYTLEQRDEAVVAAKNRLEELDARLDEMQRDLDARWETMSEKTRKRSRQLINELNKERKDVAEWYGGMRHSSAEAWEEVKKGFAQGYDRLEKAFRDARKEFDEGR